MWELYDELIEGIPPSICVKDFIEGEFWTALSSDEGGTGLAMRIDMRSREPLLKSLGRGMALKDVAAAIKSWDFVEAGFGMAAINSFYNHPEKVKEFNLDLAAPSRKNEAFAKYKSTIQGKKVAVIGHFPSLEKVLGPLCELSILERKPLPGDFPDTACEYILPEQDYVFITGVTFINKTLPRLLTLSKNAFIVMVGPSVTLSPVLFKYGVKDLSGYVVLDEKRCFELVKAGHMMKNFDAGTMVNFTPA